MTINTIKKNCLAGLTVSLALIPEAIAFAFIAGVEPLVGLYAAFIVGLITSLFGGKPGMISGATGALAVVMVSLVAQHGVQYLFATVILMGLLQTIAGMLNLGRFIRMVPHPVMLGFVNGLAIVIFTAQLQNFKIIDNLGNLAWLTGESLYIMLGLVALTMAIIKFLPKVTKAIPSTLAAILIVTILVQALSLNTATVADLASISGSLPKFSIPHIPLTFATFNIIFPYALILALIGLIESLLTVKLLNEITNTPGCYKQECIAQGLANIITGFFGGMGGCAMIGQSMINVSSGATSRLAGIFSAVCLIFFVLVGAKLIALIPIAALVGVMFIVVLNTFAWSSFKYVTKVPFADALVMITVTITTVVYDLAIAVIIGIIISSLVFAWKYSYKISFSVSLDKYRKRKTYYIHGSIFFSSITQFTSFFDIHNDPEIVFIDMQHASIFDSSAIDAINKLKDNYAAQNKYLELINLNANCQKMMTKIII